MKAIIQSYTPQECERIINGRQTIKVCKTAPKDTPFKVYMYCIKKKAPLLRVVKNGDDWGDEYKGTPLFVRRAMPKHYGKVIGEYMCEKVTPLKYNYCPHPELGYSANYDCGDSWYEWNDESIDLENFCLSEKELLTYGRGKPISCLHISNVKIYDKPKDLKEFGKYVKKQNIIDKGCEVIIENLTEFVPIRRPPYGWQYVEDGK